MSSTTEFPDPTATRSTTVTLDDTQLQLIRRETMRSAVGDLRALADHLEHLATISPWPVLPLNEDVHAARSLVTESLGTLDAVGWP